MIIIDFKTGGEAIPAHRLQLASYKYLYTKGVRVAQITRDKHNYVVGDKRYTSTTNALKIWLSHYVENNIFNDPFYANRGTYVHKCIVMLEDGTLDIDNVHEGAKGYMEAYQKAKVEILKLSKSFTQEVSYTCDIMGTGGTIDMIGNDSTDEVRTMCVYLNWKKVEGDYKIKEYELTDYDLEAFKHCLELYRYRESLRRKK